MRRCFILAALVLLLPHCVVAQVGELQPGARIRLSAPGLVANDYVGVLLQRVGDTLVVAGTNLAQVRVPTSMVEHLDVSRGKSRTEGAIAGMKWGVPIMTAFGILIGTSIENVDCRTCTTTDNDRASIVGLFALSGAMYGAGIGALIGKEDWEELDLGVKTGLVTDGRRIGLGLKYRF